MRRLLLLSAVLITLSVNSVQGQILPEADTYAITRALDDNDPKALVDALHKKSFTLSPEQLSKVDQLIIPYLVSLANSNPEESRKTIGVLSSLMLMRSSAKANTDLPSEQAATPVSELPVEIERALREKDGPKVVELIRASGFDSATVAPQKEDLIGLLVEYAQPIPASNAKANKEAYQALALLAPENVIYKQKAESYAQAEIDARSGILKKLKKRVDEFDGVTFYTHPAEPRYADLRSYLLPYIAMKNGLVVVRIQLHYTADSWLFVENATFNVDGEMIPFDVPRSAWKRDNDSEIWEWVDIPLTPDLRELLMKVEKSKKTIIRFEGNQYYDNFTVIEKDKEAIRDIFLAEQALQLSN